MDAADTCIQDDEDNIAQWEAHPTAQKVVYDGYSGLVRISDTARFEEAGIVRLKQTQPVQQQSGSQPGNGRGGQSNSSTCKPPVVVQSSSKNLKAKDVSIPSCMAASKVQGIPAAPSSMPATGPAVTVVEPLASNTPHVRAETQQKQQVDPVDKTVIRGCVEHLLSQTADCSTVTPTYSRNTDERRPVQDTQAVLPATTAASNPDDVLTQMLQQLAAPTASATGACAPGDDLLDDYAALTDLDLILGGSDPDHVDPCSWLSKYVGDDLSQPGGATANGQASNAGSGMPLHGGSHFHDSGEGQDHDGPRHVQDLPPGPSYAIATTATASVAHDTAKPRIVVTSTQASSVQPRTVHSRGGAVRQATGSVVPTKPFTGNDLRKAIIRTAVQAAKVEHHNTLLWVDDLPAAPQHQVPPKPPSTKPF